MEIIHANLPADCQIYISSCQHLGALNCSRSSLQHMIDTISSEDNSYFMGLGDAMEAITPQDKRWATVSVDWQNRLFTPEAQADEVIRVFSPIKGKILAWLMGNHEYKLMNIMQFGKFMAKGLDAPYGAACCKVHLQFNKYKPIKFYLAHGGGALARSAAKDDIQRDANKRASLKGRLQTQAGDCIGMFVGHGHDLIAVDPTAENQLYLTDDGTEIHQNYRAAADQSAPYIPPESRWYGMAGSFLKSLSPPGSEAVSYSEMAMYSPLPIGCLVATIRGGKMVHLEKLVY